MRALFDGWPLAYAPNSPAAIHLRTLLHYLPDEVEPLLALPAELELEPELAAIQQILSPSEDLGGWQQKALQKAARQAKAALIHSTMPGASLFGRIPTLISPSAVLEPESYPSRMAAAQSEGGMQRAHFLWPNDTSPPPKQANTHLIAPLVHPAFQPVEDPELPPFLPESYLLAQGPFAEGDLRGLLEAWTWGAASIGDNYPLLLLGIPPAEAEAIESLLPEYHLEDYVQLLPALAWADLVALYQGASSVVLMRGGYHWGASARLTLAVGKTLVGIKNPALEELVGPAAYLVDEADWRSLGSTMIASVVDERIWERMEEAARQRSAAWDGAQFKAELSEIYGKFA